MTQFTLKDLFWTVTLLPLGTFLGSRVWSFYKHSIGTSLDERNVVLLIGLPIAAGIACAGLFAPFRLKRSGFWFGLTGTATYLILTIFD